MSKLTPILIVFIVVLILALAWSLTAQAKGAEQVADEVTKALQDNIPEQQQAQIAVVISNGLVNGGAEINQASTATTTAPEPRSDTDESWIADFLIMVLTLSAVIAIVVFAVVALGAFLVPMMGRGAR